MSKANNSCTQPKAEDMETRASTERYMYVAGASAAYITFAISYLTTILSAHPLILTDFLLFTVLQILYMLILWRVISRSEYSPRIFFYISLLSILNICTGLFAATSLSFDWLLYLVTTAFYFMVLPVPVAIFMGSLLYLSVVVTLLYLNNWSWSATYVSNFSLLASFIFVATFSLISRTVMIQRDRAEKLLHQLEDSNRELEQAHRQLQSYANEIEELTIVRERTRVAREIHDTLGHYLSILNIQLETISKLQGRDPERLASEIAEARSVAAQSMQEVRNAVAALRPASIATLSLSEALTQLGREYTQNAGEAELTLDLETNLPTLAPDVQVTLYRAAQEALTNVRKHAHASKVLLRLRYEDALLELMILDNGNGPSSSNKSSGGFGLIGLRERIELLGGKVTYGAVEPHGYRVTIQLPLQQAV